MGTITLYTQERQGGQRSFQMGTFTTTNLIRNQDYWENHLQKFNFTPIGKELWGVNLTLSTNAFRNLNVDANYSPIPAVSLVKDGNDYRASNHNINLPYLQEQPADWEIHWRDRYNQQMAAPVEVDAIQRYLYQSGQTMPVSVGGEISPPVFHPNQYYETNQGRYLFWTTGDIYFTIRAQWIRTSLTAYEYYVGFADPGRTPSETAYYTNCLRANGMLGPQLLNMDDARDYRAALSQSYTQFVNEQVPRIFVNFVQFNYDIEEQQGQVETREMIGICVWKENLDGTINEAVITAYEKELWESPPVPPNDGPSSSPQGGRGTFSAPSDNRGDRSGATAAGIASAWNANASAFAGGYHNYFLFPSQPAAFTEMVSRLWDPTLFEGFANLMVNPFDAIVACHQLPAALAPSYGELIDVGPIEAAQATLSTSNANIFSNLIKHYHVGDVDISQYTDAFADFTDTSIYVNLPYIACVQVDTASCMHGWLAVDYLCDVTTGDIVALITTEDKFGNRQIRYGFKGNCAKPVPLYKRENLGTSFIAGSLPSVLSAVVAGATGNAMAAGAAQSMAEGAIGEIDSRLSYAAEDSLAGQGYIQYAKEGIKQSTGYKMAGRSSAIGAATGTVLSSMGASALSGAGTVQSNAGTGNATAPIDTQCWILITRPQWSSPELYARERAYPSDISQTVGEFQGLLMVSSCELNGIDCTDDELHEIDTWLKSGVLLD